MKRSCFVAAAASALLTAAPAGACMAAFMPEAVIFDRPPAVRPGGYAVFKVTLERQDIGWDPWLVRLQDPAQARRYGTVAWLEPEYLTSCTLPGRLYSAGYLVARADGWIGGRTRLRAKTYRRSWLDRVWNSFGWESFIASGGPAARP